jgi:hypothetical protein
VLARPEDAAQGLRRAVIEVLRQLNRDEMEEPEVPGLELEELRAMLARKILPPISRPETDRMLRMLVANGMARELTEPRYAWTRGRMVSNRFTITTPGKEFLLEATRRIGRI